MPFVSVPLEFVILKPLVVVPPAPFLLIKRPLVWVPVVLVRLNDAAVVGAPEAVRARTGLVPSLLETEMTSLAVEGLKVVDALVQYPTEPLPEMVPVQVKLPVEFSTVQPVAEEPPAILTSTEPSFWRLSPVEVAVTVPAPAKV